jgi:hypothetical protein
MRIPDFTRITRAPPQGPALFNPFSSFIGLYETFADILPRPTQRMQPVSLELEEQRQKEREEEERKKEIIE